MTKKSNYSASGRWSVKDSLHLLLLCAKDSDVSSIAAEFHCEESRVRRRLAAIRKKLLDRLECSASFTAAEERKKRELSSRDAVGLLRWQNGYDLSDEQLFAALRGENYLLINAGAGAGKTTVAVARVRALLACGEEPSRVLLMAFSRKCRDDVASSLKRCGLEWEQVKKRTRGSVCVDTFHACAKALGGKNDLDVFKDEGFMDDYLKNLAFSCRLGGSRGIAARRRVDRLFEYFERFVRYRGNSSLSEDFAANRPVAEASVLQSWRRKHFLTLAGERVRSAEEAAIADWLLEHGVPYTYENRWVGHDGVVLYPDFTLWPKEPKRRVILEHWGLDENNNNAGWSKEDVERYRRAKAFKLDQYRLAGEQILETHSGFSSGHHEYLLELKRQLEGRGEDCSRVLSRYEVLNRLYELGSLWSFERLVTQLSRFGNRRTMNKGRRCPGPKDDRDKLFLALYRDWCKIREASKSGKQDYDDMVRWACEKLESGMSAPFRHILVDEYQDIAPLRMRFLRALRKASGASLYAVGDDWQLIFGFTGADSQLFRDFSKVWGDRDIGAVTLTRVRRFSSELEEISSLFVLKDGRLVGKRLDTSTRLYGPAVVVCRYHGRRRDALDRISNVIREYGGDEHSLGCLTRYFFELKDCSKFYNKTTVHSSKGLEWKDVLLYNGLGGIWGFPSGVEDDPVMRMAPLPEEDISDPVLGRLSERRLFYVALTRSERRVFILAPSADHNRDVESPFVSELLSMDPRLVCEVDLDDDQYGDLL